MADHSTRPNSWFWRDWQIVMMATKYTLNRYKSHCIYLTANEDLRTEAKRAEKYRVKKAADCANSQTAEKVEPVQKFPPLIIPH